MGNGGEGGRGGGVETRRYRGWAHQEGGNEGAQQRMCLCRDCADREIGWNSDSHLSLKVGGACNGD